MQYALIYIFSLILLLTGCHQQKGNRLPIESTAQASSSDPKEPKKLSDNKSARHISSRGSETVSGIEITSPANNAVVVHRPVIEGLVEDPKAEVWLIIHPVDGPEYWVQQPVTVRRTGQHASWSVKVYIGDSETPSGTQFEIKAVANPRRTLENGMVLPGWPSAKWTSEVISVVRD